MVEACRFATRRWRLGDGVQSRYARPRGRMRSTTITMRSSSKEKRTRQSPTRRRHPIGLSVRMSAANGSATKRSSASTIRRLMGGSSRLRSRRAGGVTTYRPAVAQARPRSRFSSPGVSASPRWYAASASRAAASSPAVDSRSAVVVIGAGQAGIASPPALKDRGVAALVVAKGRPGRIEVASSLRPPAAQHVEATSRCPTVPTPRTRRCSRRATRWSSTPGSRPRRRARAAARDPGRTVVEGEGHLDRGDRQGRDRRPPGGA